jgi:hypothetical protein
MRILVVVGLTLVLATCSSLAVEAARQAGQTITPVAATALQPLLPAPAGWTKDKVKSDRFELSPTVAYTAASAVYTRDEMTVKLTIADSGKASDVLIALATMIQTLPEDYNETSQAGATLKRFTLGGSPASQRWDGANHEGELTVLVGGRFIVKAEGSHLDSVETLNAILGQVDLTKFAGLK